MHSRIFQVAYEPIREDEYTDAGYYGDRIDGADYVTECNREDGIGWLSESLSGCAEFECVNGEWKFKLKEGFRDIYFKNKHAKFIETAKALSEKNINEFMNGSCSASLVELEQAYNHDYGFYIDIDEETDTLDNFMRYASEDDTYYIGAVLDYHS